VDADYDTDGRSLSRQKDTQSRNSSRNTLTVARRNGSAQNGGMLEGMESDSKVNDHYDQTEDGKHSVCLDHNHLNFHLKPNVNLNIRLNTSKRLVNRYIENVLYRVVAGNLKIQTSWLGTVPIIEVVI
jgi:hypothetical protein